MPRATRSWPNITQRWTSTKGELWSKPSARPSKALYWKGEAAYDQHHYSDALAAFTEVVERYGGGNKAPDALLKIGLCYQNLGDVENARDVMTQLIGAYPAARASDIARARLAELEV